MRRSNVFEVEIKGYKWKVFLQSNSTFNRVHGSSAYHILYPEEREIYYNKKYFTFTFVVHEVNHAFIWSTDTEHSSNMTQDDVEDLCVTTFSKNYFKIGEIAQQILDYFGGEK